MTGGSAMQIACGFARSAKLAVGLDRHKANWGGNGRSGLQQIAWVRFNIQSRLVNYFINGVNLWLCPGYIVV